MEIILSKPTINIHEKIQDLIHLGKLAKRLLIVNNADILREEVYWQMALICNDIREFEPEFKVVYHKLSDLYDNLIALYDYKKFRGELNVY